MSTQKYTNLAKTTLSSNYTAGDSTISIADASHFPSSGDFVVAIDDPTSFFLKVTAISGTTLTVSTTAQEGYGSLSNKSTGTRVTAVLTAGMLDSIRGDMLAVGAAGSLPSTTGQTAGNVYLCNDQPVMFQFNGTIWAPFGPIFPLTLPKLSDFTVDPQAGSNATVTDTGAGISITGTNNQSSSYVRTGPASTPFTVTALVSAVAGNQDFWQFGIYGVESSTNKRIDYVIQHVSNALKYTINLFNSGPAYSSTASQISATELYTGSYYWMRIKDDGTTRSYQLSPDGYGWLTYFSHARTTWAVLNKFGFTIGSSTSFPPCYRLWHWSQTP